MHEITGLYFFAGFVVVPSLYLDCGETLSLIACKRNS